MKKIFLTFFFFFGLGFLANAQDESLIRATLNNYLEGSFKGDAAKVNQAFHSSAVLKSINAAGAVADMPVAKFVGTMPAGGMQARGASSYKILSSAYIGTSAVATVEIQFTDFKFVDLLSLLKVGSEWKIVSRVFSRAENSQQIMGNGTPSGSSTSFSSVPAASSTMPPAATNGKSSAPVKKPAPKPKASDDGW